MKQSHSNKTTSNSHGKEMTIGLIAHAGKEGAAHAVKLVIEELQARHLPFLLEKATAELVEKKHPSPFPASAVERDEISGLDEMALAEQCDVLLVMGGDGSILRALHRSASHLKPIFGLNIGSLGFLTCLGAHDYKKAIQCLADGSYVLSPRSLLKVSVSNRSQKKEVLGNALNDLVISRGERSRLVSLSVFIDGHFFTEYHADGLIIATPTGSTAYSLAAGGPVVMPESNVLLITPICPHAFSNRSMVISDQSEITIKATGVQEVFMSLDGREARLLKPEESLLLSTAPQKLSLAMLPETTFAEVLCKKLQWTGSNLKNSQVTGSSLQ